MMWLLCLNKLIGYLDTNSYLSLDKRDVIRDFLHKPPLTLKKTLEENLDNEWTRNSVLIWMPERTLFLLNNATATANISIISSEKDSEEKRARSARACQRETVPGRFPGYTWRHAPNHGISEFDEWSEIGGRRWKATTPKDSPFQGHSTAGNQQHNQQPHGRRHGLGASDTMPMTTKFNLKHLL